MAQSTETILTFKRNDDLENLSDWSIVWSTHHVPGMDMATGAGHTRRRKTGRRRLRYAALVLGCLMTMHARVSAAGLTGGYFVFILLLIPVTAILANPMRHFEVYLGQWSLSGPGRAFRIIPMFDGIGIAICIHAIFRAIVCVVLAALVFMFVVETASDRKFPFLYCRSFDLKKYEPVMTYVTTIHSEMIGKIRPNERRRTPRALAQGGNDSRTLESKQPVKFPWRATHVDYSNDNKRFEPLSNDSISKRKVPFCNEIYANNYPPIFRTPAYNYFYVEVIHYRPDHKLTEINIKLLMSIMFVWAVLWVFIIIEKISHGRMIWNNMYPWFIGIPCLWAGLLIFSGAKQFFSRKKPLRNIFHIGGHKEILDFLSDVFVAATYIHAAGLGSELIHGKGLNHYASGHIDPLLNSENVWHSSILLIMTALCSGGVSLCGLTDYMQMKGVNNMQESTVWILPLIAKCTVGDGYGHLIATLLFTGLLFSYMTVAFVCLKTALHTIFEYNVKLVFFEQLVVALLMLGCMGISVIFSTNASLGILESIDVFLAGIATPMICALEMFGLLYVYRSHDFISDMNIATEDNACSSRVGIQWQVTPFLQIFLLVIEAWMIAASELPSTFIWVGVMCTCMILLALPLRACSNAYIFLKPPKPRDR